MSDEAVVRIVLEGGDTGSGAGGGGGASSRSTEPPDKHPWFEAQRQLAAERHRAEVAAWKVAMRSDPVGPDRHDLPPAIGEAREQTERAQRKRDVYEARLGNDPEFAEQERQKREDRELKELRKSQQELSKANLERDREEDRQYRKEEKQEKQKERAANKAWNALASELDRENRREKKQQQNADKAWNAFANELDRLQRDDEKRERQQRKERDRLEANRQREEDERNSELDRMERTRDAQARKREYRANREAAEAADNAQPTLPPGQLASDIGQFPTGGNRSQIPTTLSAGVVAPDISLLDPREEAKRRRESENRGQAIDRAYRDMYGNTDRSDPRESADTQIDKQAWRKGVGQVAGLASVPGGGPDPADSISKLGDAASAAGQLIPGMGKAAMVAGESLKGFALVMKSVDETVNRYGEYSAQISQAQAIAEVRQTMGDLRRAQEVGPELVKYIQARSDVQQKFEDMKVRLLQKLVPMVARILEEVELYMPVIEGIANLGTIIANPLGGIMDAIERLTGTVADSNREPIKDPSLNLFDPRFMTAGGGTDADPGWAPRN